MSEQLDVERLLERLRETEEALRLRDRSLALVAHDLKSPLNVIERDCELLEESSTVAEHTASRERIRAAARRLRALIRELLDVAHLEAGRGLALQRTATDLVPLLAALVEEFRQTWADRTIELDTSVPALVGAFNRYRLERVFANLLSNALKYSRPGDVVRARVTVDPPGLGGGRDRRLRGWHPDHLPAPPVSRVPPRPQRPGARERGRAGAGQRP